MPLRLRPLTKPNKQDGLHALVYFVARAKKEPVSLCMSHPERSTEVGIRNRDTKTHTQLSFNRALVSPFFYCKVSVWAASSKSV
jgi:hypothetical protein